MYNIKFLARLRRLLPHRRMVDKAYFTQVTLTMTIVLHSDLFRGTVV